MTERDGGRAELLSSIEESLDLLGMGSKKTVRTPGNSGPARDIRRQLHGSTDFGGTRSLSMEVVSGEDGVRELHIHGCGKRPVKLSKSRCQVLVSGWEQLTTFVVGAGRPGTRLTDQIVVREVNDVLVVEIGGEIGRPIRLTPEKLKKLLLAQDAIRAFADD